MKIQPFSIAIPDADLDDLRARLALTRWPDEPVEAGWLYGSNLAYMKKLVAYWQQEFDWRAVEARLNRFDQFTAPIAAADGETFDIHFLHLKGSGPKPMPLLLSHGWPGSFLEFIDILEPLTHPERHGGEAIDSFDVVVPTLPGYGFSSKPKKPIGPRAIAGFWHTLMTDVLGYRRYAAQGGDWGSVVTSWLGLTEPQSLIAIHLNMIGFSPYRGAGTAPLSAAEKDWVGRVQARLSREGGYQAIQGTKPQTLNFGLTDSPVGLAAWIIEKFHGRPSAPADQPPPFSMDQLLANVSLYWLTNSIATANWIYHAVRHGGDVSLGEGQRVTVPTGFCLPPHDLFPLPPEGWLERMYNVTHRHDLDQGGHFTALECGTELVADVRRFLRPYRS
ncbi:MAG: epoxide hydrolase [Alphaproteobacteria bacterium]|jgi:microsomal epoxide hydrolase|nr:epoxide hydrolase [Alphaproteobacteria bacterium]MDP6621392.1 epoxide hydrolase [Alphaproteobacteria bacterium]